MSKINNSDFITIMNDRGFLNKITDKENLNSIIKAKRVYVGIMPLKSFLSQKID